MASSRAHRVLMAGLHLCTVIAAASDWDEFKVKREEVFEFVDKPVVARSGDRVEIAFTCKGFCDVTVAIESAEGRIVRHMVSGVLGPNAPEPFQKNSLKQVLVWDGKDDQGKYLDEKERLAVRVALGLKPKFEQSLFWSPYKSMAPEGCPLIQATPEGVCVFEGQGADHVRLYDHEGNYVRTIYPFPAAQLDQVQGLEWKSYLQDGRKHPLKFGNYECTLLTCGENAQGSRATAGKRYGHGLSFRAASAMAADSRRIALADYDLNRLAIDGTSGGTALHGPRVARPVIVTANNFGSRPAAAGPSSMAFSPDGKWLYLTGYEALIRYANEWAGREHLHAVLRMNYEQNGEPEVFLGSLDQKASGKDASQFTVPTCVACDRQGRVYVTDYMNDRIQVFTPEGAHLKSIPSSKPAWVCIHQKTGDLYVFSWMVLNTHIRERLQVPSQLTHLGPLEDPRLIGSYDLPGGGYQFFGAWWYTGSAHPNTATLDSWCDPPRIWIGQRRGYSGWKGGEAAWGGKGSVLMLEERAGKLTLKRDFDAEARRAVARLTPPLTSRQRLYVNPKNERLYVAEGTGLYGTCSELLEIDPQTRKVQTQTLPFDAEDLAFDLNGLAYLRTDNFVVRYDPETWREVPFDYGEEREKVGSRTKHEARVISGIPTTIYCDWHLGGMGVSPKGHLVMSTSFAAKGYEKRDDEKAMNTTGKSTWSPRLYPGRLIWGKAGILQVWDKHGKVAYEDPVPGLDNLNGVYMDKDDAIYVMSAGTRFLDGKIYPNGKTGTLIKFTPKVGKVVAGDPNVPIPLPEGARPARAPDVSIGGGAWLEGAQWLYGGVGHDVTKGRVAGEERTDDSRSPGCACSNSRFAVDYFGRSFAPEMELFSVAVLDTNGNLMLRIGQYGNVDDGRPSVVESGPPNSRSIGGDETAFFYPAYVATHTDRRLFVADIGNARVVSVKLGYHTEEKVALGGGAK